MRKVIWTDRYGFRHASLVRDEDKDDMAPYGIPISLDLREVLDLEAIRELNNLLVDRGLLGYTELMVAQTGLTDAIASVVRRKVIMAFKQAKQEAKQL